MDAGDVGGDAEWGRHATLVSSQCVTSSCEERPDRVVALERPPVEGEEQAFEVRHCRVGQVRPHAADHLVGLARGVRAKGGQALLGPRLHLADDGEQEAVPRAEVVEEHAMAGADGLGDAAQALVGQPLRREVRDDGIEQRRSGASWSPPAPPACFAARPRPCPIVPACTKWYIPRGPREGTRGGSRWRSR